MTLRRRILPVAAMVVALGGSAAGAAMAADTGASPAAKPAPAAGKTVVTIHDKDKGDKGKGDDKGKGKDPGKGKDKGGDKYPAELAKAAAKLGVSPQQLENALRDTKVWINQAGKEPTPGLIVQHVADLLHKPVAAVKEALAPLLDPGPGQDGGKGKGGDKGKDPGPGKDKGGDKSGDKNPPKPAGK